MHAFTEANVGYATLVGTLPAERLAHLAALVEYSHDAVISKTLEGRILSWNPAAQRIFGYSAEEAVGQHVTLIVPPDRLEEERQILDKLRHGESFNQLETVRLAKDGRAIDVAVTISPVRDGRGTIIGAVNMARDITLRKNAERALQRANAELAARTAELARFNHVAVGRELRMIELKQEVNLLRERQGERPLYPLELDEEPHSIQAVYEVKSEALAPLESIVRTQELRKRPNRSADYEFESRLLADLVQTLADSPRNILQLLADKLLEVLRAGSAGLSLLTRDGKGLYWAAVAGQWSSHPGGGVPRGFAPCGDVLDRGEPMLFTHWERRYPYLAEVTPLAEEGLVVPFRVGGRPVGTIWAIAHDTGRRFDAEDLRLIEGLGRFASAAYQTVEYIGAIEQRRAALNLLEDTVHTREIAEDSNRKLRESEGALREADQRKNEFLAMLAHELRNPLAPIGTASELLLRTAAGDSRSQAAIGMIKRQIAQLTRLVDDLLDVSRVSQGRIQLQRRPVDLEAIIHQAVETVEPQLREKCHKLSVTTESYEPLYVLGDLARLVQCVSNILTNAIKYTESGGHIAISSRADGQNVLIKVTDTGAGISSELLPHVFDLFVQSDRTLDRAQGGLGIGLAVVKRLVEMQGGEVAAHSEGAGRGSSFEIRMPRITRPLEEASDRAGVKTAPRRVLIVDDNADAANSLSMLLAMQGHETGVAYDARAALAQIKTFKPDVVLLDIGLPEMNGYELAKHLRAMPELSGLRLVALTGYGQTEDYQRALASGFEAHLVKPVELASLERMLAGAPAHAGRAKE